MSAAIEYLFGHCHLFPAERRLLAAGAPVKLGGRAFDLLVALVERRERTVSKAELIERVWPNLVVEENNLQVQVAALRKLLGHPAIATVPGRGYRFALPVRVCGEVGHEAAGAADETGSSGSSGSSASSGSALPPSAPVPLPLGLRERLPVLFGRADDVRAVQALLAEHGFVSIVGPGGVGKTRLAEAVACEAAAERADAAWWVDLAPLSQASLLPAALSAALRLPPVAGQDPHQRVLAELARRDGLVVLDNAEHLVEQVAAFAVELRRHAPRVRLLVTSQVVLRAAGECVFRATPLAVPAQDDPAAVAASAAVALFVARAQAADRGFALRVDNVAAVAALCRGLDGMPLAIELAASRVALLGVEGLRTRLDERLRVLTVATRGAPPRHRTLQAALEWSHELLHPDERAVLRRLAVFVDGFTLEAAQQVAADEALDGWDVLEYLGALVDRSLVQAETQAEGDPLPRYRLLETTRQFALEQLAKSGEEAAVRDRHQAWVLALAEETERHFAGADTAAWVERLAREQANLLAALAWSHGEASAERELRLVALLRHFGGAFCIVAEGYAACLAALARPACQAPTRWRARALAATAMQAYQMGRLADARDLDEQALAVARACADPEAAARALIGLSFVATSQGDLATARSRLEEAEAAARDAGHERLLASVLTGQAIAMQRAGDLDGAAARYAENLALWQRLGHGYNQAVDGINLASVHRAAGRGVQARALLAEAIAQARRIGAPRQLVAAIAAAAAQGDDGHAAPTSVIRLHAALAALRAAAGFDAALEADEQQVLDRARSAVGHEARLQAERAGRLMGWAQVLDEASAVVAVCVPPAPPADARVAGAAT